MSFLKKSVTFGGITKMKTHTDQTSPDDLLPDVGKDSCIWKT